MCLPCVEDIPLKGGLASSTNRGDPLTLGESVLAAPERPNAEVSEQLSLAIQSEAPVSQMEPEVEISSLTYAERKKKISRDKRSTNAAPSSLPLISNLAIGIQ